MNKQQLLEDLKKAEGKRFENYAIISGNHHTFESAVNEAVALTAGSVFLKWLSPICSLIYLPVGYERFLEAVKNNHPIFIQHIFPVQAVLSINEENVFMDKLTDFVKKNFLSKISPLPFSVQTTVLDGKSLSSYEINNAVSDMLVRSGKNLDVKNPVHILSIVIENGTAYLGLSSPEDNLSKWACGIAHYSKNVNRAENKLLESVEHFKLNLSGGNALDIGAAPGGWTKCLHDMGYKVWAVDPALLNAEVMSLENVRHCAITAQKFLDKNSQMFDVIVNDMVMDCRESAEIMNRAQEFLRKDGVALFTAKLPKQGYNKRLKTAIKILSRKYIVAGVRQLPSNKSEVTVTLEKATRQ